MLSLFRISSQIVPVRRYLCLVLAAVLFSGALFPQPITIDQRYMKLSDDELSSINSALDDLSSAYADLFGVRNPYPLRLIMFGDFSRYKDFQLKEDDYPGGTDYGYYYDLKKHAVIVWDPARASREEAFTTTVHEICHLMNKRLFPSISLWANEGLAVLFERMKFDKGMRFEHAPFESSFNELAIRANDGKLPQLSTWVGQKESAALFRDGGYDAYQLSWSLVFYFLADPARARSFIAILTRMGIEPDAALIDRHYAGGMKQLSDDWQAFLRENRFGMSWDFTAGDKRKPYRPDPASVKNILAMITCHEHLTNARRLIDDEHFAAAIPPLAKAAAIAPDSFSIWFEKGYAHLSLKQYADAAKSFSAANKADSGHKESWHNLAIAYAMTGRTNDAIESYRKANAIDPNNFQRLCELAELCEDMRRYTEAADAYSKAIALSNDEPRAWYGKGRSLAALGRTNEARDACTKAVDRRCEDPYVYYTLASLTSTPAQLAEMLNYLSEALTRDRSLAQRAARDPAFIRVRDHAAFKALVKQ